MIFLKSPSEIRIIKANGTILKECFELAARIIKAGVTRREIDQAIEDKIIARGARPAFKGFQQGLNIKITSTIGHLLIFPDTMLQLGPVNRF